MHPLIPTENRGPLLIYDHDLGTDDSQKVFHAMWPLIFGYLSKEVPL